MFSSSFFFELSTLTDVGLLLLLLFHHYFFLLERGAAAACLHVWLVVV
jgi:hypothetical protein